MYFNENKIIIIISKLENYIIAAYCLDFKSCHALVDPLPNHNKTTVVPYIGVFTGGARGGWTPPLSGTF